MTSWTSAGHSYTLAWHTRTPHPKLPTRQGRVELFEWSAPQKPARISIALMSLLRREAHDQYLKIAPPSKVEPVRMPVHLTPEPVLLFFNQYRVYPNLWVALSNIVSWQTCSCPSPSHLSPPHPPRHSESWSPPSHPLIPNLYSQTFTRKGPISRVASEIWIPLSAHVPTNDLALSSTVGRTDSTNYSGPFRMPFVLIRV